MNAVKITYIICQTIGSLAILGAGAWMTYRGGSGWWVTGGIILAMMGSYGFTQRLNSWGDMGKL